MGGMLGGFGREWAWCGDAQCFPLRPWRNLHLIRLGRRVGLYGAASKTTGLGPSLQTAWPSTNWMPPVRIPVCFGGVRHLGPQTWRALTVADMPPCIGIRGFRARMPTAAPRCGLRHPRRIRQKRCRSSWKATSPVGWTTPAVWQQACTAMKIHWAVTHQGSRSGRFPLLVTAGLNPLHFKDLGLGAPMAIGKPPRTIPDTEATHGSTRRSTQSSPNPSAWELTSPTHRARATNGPLDGRP